MMLSLSRLTRSSSQGRARIIIPFISTKVTGQLIQRPHLRPFPIAAHIFNMTDRLGLSIRS